MREKISYSRFFSLNVFALTLALFSPHLLAANLLSLGFISPPVKFDWSTPRALTWSVSKAFVKGNPGGLEIGHAFVHLRCGSKEIWAGMMGGESKEFYKALVSDGAGLGILFYNFAGTLEDQKSVESYLPEYEEDQLSWLKVAISDSTCERLMRYHTEYEASQNWKNYGLPNRPLYGEGSGCSAFAASFLEVAGLLDSHLQKAWSRTLLVPEVFIGKSDHKVSFLKLLALGKTSNRWAMPSEEHKKIFFYDPQLMDEWVRSLPQRKVTDGKYKRVHNVVYWDAREVPTPRAPIWKH